MSLAWRTEPFRHPWRTLNFCFEWVYSWQWGSGLPSLTKLSIVTRYNCASFGGSESRGLIAGPRLSLAFSGASSSNGNHGEVWQSSRLSELWMFMPFSNENKWPNRACITHFSLIPNNYWSVRGKRPLAMWDLGLFANPLHQAAKRRTWRVSTLVSCQRPFTFSILLRWCWWWVFRLRLTVDIPL